MKVTRLLLAAMAIVAMGAGGALACGNCGAKSASASEASAGCPAMSCPPGCPMSACQAGAGHCDFAASCLNSIRYQVSSGDQHLDTFDRDAAFALAKSTGAPVKFYVMDAAYTDETEAKKALFASLDQRLKGMLAVQCVVNGQTIPCEKAACQMAAAAKGAVVYRVGSHDFATKAAARSYLRKLQAKVASVNVVDARGKPVHGCAAAYAEHCGNKNLTFKVGDQVAADAVTADVLRAQEQLRIVLASEA